MSRETEIFAIFGEIEEVAANKMVEDGHATRIEPYCIPERARRNAHGDPAKFAIIIDGSAVASFEKLIADLRA